MAGIIPPRPLTAEDDCKSFDCGREPMNAWFHRHAWRNQQSGVSRTNVICNANTGEIVGCVSLSAAQIERSFLPKSAQRNQPDRLPVILLGQLAIDCRYQGPGYARSLMWFALMTSMRFANEVGCFGILTHPIADELRVFYRRFGFEDLPFDPGRAMIIRIAELERNGFVIP